MTTDARPGVKVFADGADLSELRRLAQDPLIDGATTNPTLMRKAGVKDYEACGRELAALLGARPLSLEVLSDDFAEMEKQALRIAAWGENVYVKIPVTDTRGVYTTPLVSRLARAGVKVNVTAVLTLDQLDCVLPCLAAGPPAYVSIFAGRIADTGRDPVPVVSAAVERLRHYPNVELIWASSRELFNLVQAESAGCHIITLGFDLLKKLPMRGRDLHLLSLETVRMFVEDGRRAGYVV